MAAAKKKSRSGPSGPNLSAAERRKAGIPSVTLSMTTETRELLVRLADERHDGNRSECVREALERYARRGGLRRISVKPT
jgi:hypothetical protein